MNRVDAITIEAPPTATQARPRWSPLVLDAVAKERGWDRDRLAAHLGVSRTTVARIYGLAADQLGRRQGGKTPHPWTPAPFAHSPGSTRGCAGSSPAS